jgi:CBS domain-containing membrane protein
MHIIVAGFLVFAEMPCGPAGLIGLGSALGISMQIKRLKFPPGWRPEPLPTSLAEQFRSALAAGLAIFLLGLISSRFIEGGGLKTLVASMGASAVILFVVPHSPMARPWSVVGGHLISGLIGILCARWVPDTWPAAALAVGLAIFAMQLARCLHPPGGASALIPVLGDAGIRALGFQFLLTPLALNVAVMLVASRFYDRWVHAARPAPNTEPHPPSPLERIGIQAEDFHAALQDVGVFVDVSADELSDIYHFAASRAFRRTFGETTCAGIMTPEPLTAEFGDDLESVWRRMQRHGIRALPVVDRGRHVIGIVTFKDFFRHAPADGFGSLKARLKALLLPSPRVTSTKPEVVGQIMTAPAITARHDAPIVELARLLSEHGIHQVPIVDERRKLVGLVTQTDLIAALYRSVPAGLAQPAMAVAS